MPNLDQAGLIGRILKAVQNIDIGRKSFATHGEERKGHLTWETDISTAMTAFRDAQAAGDIQTMILAEQAFLRQELHFCDERDTITRNSLIHAIQCFDDALRSLTTAADSAAYKAAETSYGAGLKGIAVFPGIRKNTNQVRLGLGQVLNEKRDAILAKAVPAQFDAGYKDWLASGGQAIIDERTAKWKQFYGDKTSVD